MTVPVPFKDVTSVYTYAEPIKLLFYTATITRHNPNKNKGEQ